MDAAWRLLTFTSRSPPPLPKHEDDIIYPLYLLDDTRTNRSVIMNWTLHFNDVLDSIMLKDSLAQLLEIGDWRKVGGRLRIKMGDLRFMPRECSRQTDLPSLSRIRNSISSVEEHSLARRLPRPTETPSFHPGPLEFQALGPPVRTMQDVLIDDTPMLILHITSFTDVTLVILSIPHVLTDVMGQHALVRAWSLVLSGQSSSVPPLLGAHESVLDQALATSSTNPEPFKMASQEMSTFGLICLALRMVWDMLRSGPGLEKTTYIPASCISRFQDRARKDLSLLKGEPSQPFISTSDVLITFLTRTVALSLSLPSPRPVTLGTTVNARFRIPLIKVSKGIYMQTMALAAFTSLSASEIASIPLGLLALQSRQSLMEQATEAQILAMY